MIDPALDGQEATLRRAFATTGRRPRIVYGDYPTAADLVASGELITVPRD